MYFDKCQFIHSYLDIQDAPHLKKYIYCYYCQQVLNIINIRKNKNILIFDEFDNFEIDN